MNKVVARFADGRVLKGSTSDFTPAKETFHLVAVDASPGSKPIAVRMQDLKAVFFVKDFSGNPQHQERKEFDAHQPATGKKIVVLFKDGEVLVGTTQAYQPNRPGFFLLVADKESNIERCFVVTAAVQEVQVL